MDFQRILITVDGSAVSAHAADVGFDLARALGADAAVVNAVDRSDAVVPESGVGAPDLMALAEQEGRAILAETVGRAHLRERPTEFLCRGNAAKEIVNVARSWAANVIVIGSHGRGGMTRLLLGSVAESVMRHAPCPVLVVRQASGPR
jgi:nucleotide-binding universal stress UspA family protein